jgi:hypothetical protein
VVGETYTFSFTASGVPTPTWSLNAGALPPGLALHASGVLSGAPTASGVYSFTVRAGNDAGAAEQAVSLAVNLAPAITSHAPPAAVVGETYTFTFTASGAPTPTWSLSTGALPPGLALDSVTGTLSGAPTIEGVYAFAIEASNGVGSPAAQQITLTVMARRWLPLVVN